jgi:GNAT superfamily N-acetyltransferase
VTILLLRDPEAFAQRAWDFLEARIECNILATVLSAVRSGALAGREVSRREGGGTLFACVLDGSGRIQGAALRTPLRPMLASPLDRNAAEELIGTWMAEDPGLDAVNAVASTARALAAAWARRTGGRTETQMRMAMHALESVTDPPRLASGRLVPVAAGQLDTLIEWWAAFAAEADVGSDVESAPSVARARMNAGGAYFWEHEGRPVSLVAINPAVAGVARVGPVYTPPSQRGRGYAGSAVAALSRRALAEGAERCALFTDLANPTSNKIYAEVGYRALDEWETIALKPAGARVVSALAEGTSRNYLTFWRRLDAP